MTLRHRPTPVKHPLHWSIVLDLDRAADLLTYSRSRARTALEWGSRDDAYQALEGLLESAIRMLDGLCAAGSPPPPPRRA